MKSPLHIFTKFKRVSRLGWISLAVLATGLVVVGGTAWALVSGPHHAAPHSTGRQAQGSSGQSVASSSAGGSVSSTPPNQTKAADGSTPHAPASGQGSAATPAQPSVPTGTTTPTAGYSIPANAVQVSTSAGFQSAVSSATAGTTIVLRAGTYTGVSLTLSKQLTIEAYPGETVWMDGQNSLQYALYMVTNASGSLLRGIGFRNYASTKDFSQKPAMVIVASSVSSGVTIDHCTFENSAAAGASVQANHSVVTNNLFTSNNWIGLHVNHADGIDVENNIMSNNNTGNNATSGTTAAAAGAKFTYTRGATIKNNQFINNNSNGLWIDLQASDIVISGNAASGNARNGIYYEVSTRGTITGNTVANNAAYGIELSGSNNTTVTGNSLSGNTGGNTFAQEDPRTAANDTQCSAGAAYGADCDSYSNTVQSN
jgi:parallel beta-helix repeat protein